MSAQDDHRRGASVTSLYPRERDTDVTPMPVIPAPTCDPTESPRSVGPTGDDRKSQAQPVDPQSEAAQRTGTVEQEDPAGHHGRRDTDVTPPAPGRDTAASWVDPGPTEGRVVLDAVEEVDAEAVADEPDDDVNELIVEMGDVIADLRADRDRLERQVASFRESHRKAAAADFRSREAIRLALEELRAPGRAAALVIADAEATLANLLDGRPLAAARDTTARPVPGPLQPGVKL